MLNLNRNILSLPTYILGNLGKKGFKEFLGFENEELLKSFYIKNVQIFISSIGKREYLSFPEKGTIIFKPKVEEGILTPEILKEAVGFKEKENIIPILVSLSPFREALILLSIKGERYLKESELVLLKLYFKERLNRIYYHGKKFIREGEYITSILHLLDKKDRSFTEKINILLNIVDKLRRQIEIYGIDLTEFLFNIISYDLGKIFFRDEVLSGAKTLEPEDRLAILNHPYYSIDLIQHITFVRKIREAIKTHHENYDGGGYPRGIGGEDIPKEARFLRILDTLSSLMVFRHYRERLDFEKAKETITEDKGKIFDPKLVDFIMSYLENIENPVSPSLKKYKNKEVTLTLKKHPKNKIEGKIKENMGRILSIIGNQYFTVWDERQIPPLPKDKVFLYFPTLGEEIEGKVVDVNYDPHLTVKVDISKEDYIEVRRNPRVPWIIPIEIFDGETTCMALSTDISSEGAQIIPLGSGIKKRFKREIIDIDFTLPPNTTSSVHFHMKGKVIRYSKSYSPPFYKIVKFINMKEKDRILLEDFIRERQIDILFLE